MIKLSWYFTKFFIKTGTIFAYGQTGTGKTFTSSGILSHSFAHIFGYIAKSGNDTQFLVRASFYEIYNEDIKDLLVSIFHAFSRFFKIVLLLIDSAKARMPPKYWN